MTKESSQDTFISLDRDGDGKLSFGDLVNVFGAIDSVTFEKAKPVEPRRRCTLTVSVAASYEVQAIEIERMGSTILSEMQY